MAEDQFKEDVFAEITYDIAAGRARIRTNARDVDEFLTSYVHATQGDGKTDDRRPVERKEYHVRVSCDLSFDTFRVRSDCGNTSLDTGIIAHSIGNWDLD